MYAVYSVLLLGLMVAAAPWLAWQALRHRKYIGSLGQRLGYLPLSFNIDADPSIWVHAVSVGEVLTARPLLRELRRRHPRLKLFLSTTTRAGQEVARRHASDVDGIFYFPFDLAPFVRRTLDIVRPRLLVVLETEIWPVLLRECRRRGVKTALVNGRLSERSFPRYRLIRRAMRRVLADIDRLCVQSEGSSRRFVELGADPARVTVTGSLKFDALPATMGSVTRTPDRVLRYFRLAAERPVIVAGSTMSGEELLVLRAYRRVRAALPASLLILAPRHPERFGEVERLCRDEGFHTRRRQDLAIDADPRCEVVLLDTVGELATVYQLATVVFVGGSLVATGGHNILEPAAWGKPTVFGPHMQNFAEIAATVLANEAGVQVASGDELADVLRALLADPVRRARLGAAARALVQANRGANEKTLRALDDLLPTQRTGTHGNVRPFRPLA